LLRAVSNDVTEMRNHRSTLFGCDSNTYC